MRSFTAKKNDEGVRLNRFCQKVCPNMPASLLHKSFRNKRIKVNGKKQAADYKIQCDDLIELYINDEFFVSKPTEVSSGSFAKLDIIYEDENILLLFKPFGLLCHSDHKNQENLIDMVTAYLIAKKEYAPLEENTFKPALCNRIDQGTEGIVIAAKNYPALACANQIIRENLLEKIYVCITCAPVKSGQYVAWHKRNLDTKKVTITGNQTIDTKKIVTGFQTLKSDKNYHLVQCKLITGRTHQIRAHLAFLNAPILGDKKYGKGFAGLDSQALCAYQLEFKELPPNLYLGYLSEKKFEVSTCSVIELFNKLTSKPDTV